MSCSGGLRRRARDPPPSLCDSRRPCACETQAPSAKSALAELGEDDWVDAVDALRALLEILRADPVVEGGLEALVLVAETPQAVAQLGCEGVVHRQPLVLGRLAEQEVVHLVQAPKLV